MLVVWVPVVEGDDGMVKWWNRDTENESLSLWVMGRAGAMEHKGYRHEFGVSAGRYQKQD